jgi:hypothetical protein
LISRGDDHQKIIVRPSNTEDGDIDQHHRLVVF